MTKAKDEATVVNPDVQDLDVLLRGSVRALLDVFEAGPLSIAQRGAILRARVLLGDAKAPGCLHDAGDFRDADDVLRCVLCHEELEAAPVNGQPGSANETPSQSD